MKAKAQAQLVVLEAEAKIVLVSEQLKQHPGGLMLLCVVTSRCTYLDVVQVDLSEGAVIVQDPLQGLLHVSGVGRLLGEDLEWICFHDTCV